LLAAVVCLLALALSSGVSELRQLQAISKTLSTGKHEACDQHVTDTTGVDCWVGLSVCKKFPLRSSNPGLSLEALKFQLIPTRACIVGGEGFWVGDYGGGPGRPPFWRTPV